MRGEAECAGRGVVVVVACGLQSLVSGAVAEAVAVRNSPVHGVVRCDGVWGSVALCDGVRRAGGMASGGAARCCVVCRPAPPLFLPKHASTSTSHETGERENIASVWGIPAHYICVSTPANPRPTHSLTSAMQ